MEIVGYRRRIESTLQLDEVIARLLSFSRSECRTLLQIAYEGNGDAFEIPSNPHSAKPEEVRDWFEQLRTDPTLAYLNELREEGSGSYHDNFAA
jgi:hypothetical protein